MGTSSPERLSLIHILAHLIIAGGGLPLIGIPPGLRRPIRREWAELMPERAAELLAEYQSWLRRFAAAFRLPVLDFDRAFTRWGEEGLFQPDGLHPNAAGHCLMAETAACLLYTSACPRLKGRGSPGESLWPGERDWAQ